MTPCLGRFDPEPRHIKRGQEQQDQDGANSRAPDQSIGHRSPEHGMRKRDEGQPDQARNGVETEGLIEDQRRRQLSEVSSR